MEEYRRFLAVWECIRQMNNKGIYFCGYATQQDGNYKVEFSCDNEKENYKAVFGL